MKHPMQKIYFDKTGVARFTENSIVNFLVEKFGLTELHRACQESDHADWDQLNQLIGYSVSGCPMMNQEAQDAAQAIVEGKEADPRDAYIKELEARLYLVKKVMADVVSDLFDFAPGDFYTGEVQDSLKIEYTPMTREEILEANRSGKFKGGMSSVFAEAINKDIQNIDATVLAERDALQQEKIELLETQRLAAEEITSLKRNITALHETNQQLGKPHPTCAVCRKGEDQGDYILCRGTYPPKVRPRSWYCQDNTELEG